MMVVAFEITGRAAHGRIAPLLPDSWIDLSPYAKNDDNNDNNTMTTTTTVGSDTQHLSSKTIAKNNKNNNNDDIPSSSTVLDKTKSSSSNKTTTTTTTYYHEEEIDFLWENAPRHETRHRRDDVAAYSHLPNGISVLDDKWSLSRLFSTLLSQEHDDDSSPLAILESHCFRGPQGFRQFCTHVGMFQQQQQQQQQQQKEREDGSEDSLKMVFPDLLSDHPAYLFNSSSSLPPPPPPPSNLWVIKDAGSNGAGGIWIVSPTNAQTFLPSSSSSSSSPLLDGHRYVAQKYAWPLVLYNGRKCHVRVYAFMTCTGKAYVHNRAFLHVANDLFQDWTTLDEKKDDEELEAYRPSIHITNCCANSHDVHKFTGEICVSFSNKNDDTLSLEPFFPSIAASVAALAKQSFPFLGGGEANGGFEYLGLDFVLSYRQTKKDVQPIAYLLEVNAPPSQDTATGLEHAEQLHNDVLRDLIHLWVIPNVMSRCSTTTTDHRHHHNQQQQHQQITEPTTITKNGWRCVYRHSQEEHNHNKKNHEAKENLIVPSKAAILNKVRWAMFERKCSKLDPILISTNNQKETQRQKKMQENQASLVSGTSSSSSMNSELKLQQNDLTYLTPDIVSQYARSQFPYFDTFPPNNNDSDDDNGRMGQKSAELTIGPQTITTTSLPAQRIFLENAGGSQVPQSVIQGIVSSISYRHRCVLGSHVKSEARRMILHLLGASSSSPSSDTTTTSTTNNPPYRVFFGQNATMLFNTLATRMIQWNFFSSDDEIVLSSENHLANVTPWLMAAKATGIKIKWWTSPHWIEAPSSSSSVVINNNDSKSSSSSSPILQQLLTSKTKLIVITHASNVLGIVRDIPSIRNLVSRHYCSSSSSSSLSSQTIQTTRPQIVVDGVAAVPHCYANISKLGIDWYVISCHKLFGPHLGCLCASESAIRSVMKMDNNDDDANTNTVDENDLYRAWETGTINFEACGGILGLYDYFIHLSKFVVVDNDNDGDNDNSPKKVSSESHHDRDAIKEQEDEQQQTTHQMSGPITTTTRRRTKERIILCSPPSSSSSSSQFHSTKVLHNTTNIFHSNSKIMIQEAYRRIRLVEEPIIMFLQNRFESYSNVRVLGNTTTVTTKKNDDDNSCMCQNNNNNNNNKVYRIPILTFVHFTISSSKIVKVCQEKGGIVCRNGTFLNTFCFLVEQGVVTDDDDDDDDNSLRKKEREIVAMREGMVRVSFTHYNTLDEAQFLCHVLEGMDDW